jgi:hypothetical protein
MPPAIRSPPRSDTRCLAGSRNAPRKIEMASLGGTPIGGTMGSRERSRSRSEILTAGRGRGSAEGRSTGPTLWYRVEEPRGVQPRSPLWAR